MLSSIARKKQQQQQQGKPQQQLTITTPTKAATLLNCESVVVRSYDLKGYERSFSMSKSGCTRLAHVLQLNIVSTNATTSPHFNLALLLRHVPSAFARVMRKHPMMRARVSKQDPLVCEIIPAMDVTDEQVQRDLVKLVPFDVPNGTEDQHKEQVRKIVEDTCNQTVDRTTQFSYFLTVAHESDNCVESKNAACTFILFSDHALSDIVSGMEVLKDLLDILRLLVLIEHYQNQNENTAKQEQLQKELDEIGKELPLRPPLYDLLRPPPSLWQRGSDAMITSFGETFLTQQNAKFHPLLSARLDEMKDVDGLPLPHNPSYCYMAVGKQGQAHAAIQQCQAEKIPITSAITACLVLAYHNATKTLSSPSLSGPSSTNVPAVSKSFHMEFYLQYNDMRRRNKMNQFPETTVGCHVFMAAQDFLSNNNNKGLDLSMLSFWKVARLAATCAEKTVSGTNAMAEYIYSHYKFHASVPTLHFKAQRGITSDASLAYAEYPHATTYDMSFGPSNNNKHQNSKITIQGFHVYHSIPNISYGASIFITVVNDTFHYTLMSKLSDEDSKKLLQYIVTTVEGIPDMTDETMLQAVERLFK